MNTLNEAIKKRNNDIIVNLNGLKAVSKNLDESIKIIKETETVIFGVDKVFLDVKKVVNDLIKDLENKLSEGQAFLNFEENDNIEEAMDCILKFISKITKK